MDDFHRANPDLYPLLKEYAKEMRKFPTEAELELWRHIKYNTLGIWFRRQVVILDFIADFYAPELSLIIEVDGGYHDKETQIPLDEARTKRLEAKGYVIIRFTNEEVLTNIESVLSKIKNFGQNIRNSIIESKV